MKDYKDMIQRESSGTYPVGVRVEMAYHRPVNEEEASVLRRFTDDFIKLLWKNSTASAPQFLSDKKENVRKLVECFPETPIFVKEIPNGYCSDPCCLSQPWLIVTTKIGRIKIGWRIRVIEIDWTDVIEEIQKDAHLLFVKENTTKVGNMIHAWGYEKAKEYLAKILNAPMEG